MPISEVPSVSELTFSSLFEVLFKKNKRVIAILPVKSFKNEVISEIQLGELLCDSLAEAEDASLLNFAIGASEVG